MIDFIDVEVSKLEEARPFGAEKLGVSAEDVEIEVLAEQKRGLFGRKNYRVRVYRKEEPQKKGAQEQLGQEQAAQEGVDIKQKADKSEAQKEGKLLAELSGDFALFYFHEDGLYCLVPAPSAGEPQVEYLQVAEEITRKGFVNVNYDRVGTAVDAPGVKVKIAGPQPKHLMTASRIKVHEPKDSYVAFEFRSDGVYAKAHIKGSPLDFSQVIEEIERRKLKEVDTDQVIKVVEGSPDFIKIAPVQPKEVLKDGRCHVEVSQDEMKATVKVEPPFGGKPVTEEEVKAALKEAGVVIDIDQEELSQIVSAGQFHPCETSVTGYPPTRGQDASLEYLFSREKKGAGPKELEDGRVDYKELGAVQNVRKGDVLVIKHPPGLGSPGMTVTGKEIPPASGKDLVLSAGKNTEISEDGLKLIAAIDGQPVMQGNKICVLPVYEVPGDVDLSVGNIDFVGNVIVRGKVLSGMTVKAQGEVDIYGNVEDATIDAKGNVRIRNGVTGHGKAVIRTGSNINVRFAENATLIASNDIKVGEALMHCQVRCGGKVDVGGRKGLIVGGVIKAGEQVHARIIGNKLATQTVIEVGIDPQLREELQNVRHQIEHEQESLQKTQRALETLKNLQKAAGSLPQEKQEFMLKLTRTQFQLMAKIKQLTVRRHELEELTKKKAGGKISVSDTIFSGVSITIGDASLVIKDEKRYVTLTEKDGEIKESGYRK